MERKESFVFYASFADALAMLDDGQRLQLYDAIVGYALRGEIPTSLTGIGSIIWRLIEPQIRANYERWKKGCRGGRRSDYEDVKHDVKHNVKHDVEHNVIHNVKHDIVHDVKHDVKPNENENVNENVNENENVNVNDIKGSKPARPSFIKPTFESVERYVLDKGYEMDAREFYDYYESNGWMVGKNKMKSWTAAVANWNRREKEMRPRRTRTVAMPNALVTQPDFYDD